MSTDEERFPAITDEERKPFDDMIAVVRGQFANARIALMRVEFDGQPAVVATIISEVMGGDDYNNTPIALMVTPALFERLTPPYDAEEGT